MAHRPARLPRLRDAASATSRFLRTSAEVAGLLYLVWVVGQRAHAFTGFPKGYDATGHLSKAQFIMSNWPHIFWNYEWYSGQPTFAGSYPPGYHMLLAATSWTAHVSLPTAMNATTYGAVALLVVGLYAIVRAATGSHLGALLAAGLLTAAPTMWSQTVTLGLYPRFIAFSFLAPALATAIVFARRGGRLPALATVMLLAVSLSMHPIVGVLGIALIVGVVIVGRSGSLPMRAVTAAALVGAGLVMAAYFYFPLAVESRSQSLFTNTEIPLRWRSLGWPGAASLDALTPGVLPLSVIVAVVAVVLCRKPRVSHASKVALGADVLLLTQPPRVEDLPPTAARDVTRYARWHWRNAGLGYQSRLCLLFVGVVPCFLAYGLVGYVAPRFPFYINGLQPSDLLVYPAFLCCATIGIAAGVASSQAVERWRARSLRRLVTLLPWCAAGIASLAAVVAVVALALSPLVARIAPAASFNDTPAQIARLTVVPADASAQRDFRIAGVADSVTKWLNEYSAAPQDRGYDDHGALHFDWQNWLEQTLTKTSFTPAERDFLLDWYGIKWVDTDTGGGDVTPYADTTRFRLLATETNYATVSSYLYKDARPIMSAVDVPAVLVVGDAQHYDLLLRALSYADIGSDQLIPVQGPASLDDVSSAELTRFDAVFLYGASVGDADRDAKTLRAYASAGGGLVVDAADDQAAMQRLAAAKDSPLPVSAAHDVQVKGPGWAWTPTTGDPLLGGIDLDGFGPASYAGEDIWSVAAAVKLRPSAHVVLRAHRAAVLVADDVGAGHVVWSGLGLPYHVDSFESAAESSLLGRMILQTITSRPRPAPRYQADFVSSQRMRVEVSAGAGGVLLKEQDAPGWKATLDGRATTVYSAGPGMMWISLPDDGGPHVIDVRYHLSGAEKLGYVISALALLLWLALFVSKRLWRRGERLIERLIVSGSSLLNPGKTWRHRMVDAIVGGGLGRPSVEPAGGEDPRARQDSNLRQPA